MNDVIERLWTETGKFIAAGQGGHIVVSGVGVTEYIPVDFNGDDSSQVLMVETKNQAKVAMMFWRPDAAPESSQYVIDWLKAKGISMDEFNKTLSESLLEFREAYKDRLFQIARQILVGDLKKVAGDEKSIVTVEKKEKKHPLKSKTIWTGGAAVATGTAAVVHGSPSHLMGLLMMVYGWLVMIWRFVTDRPIR